MSSKDSDHLDRCACTEDGFEALPPELRPKARRKRGLRRTVCSGCGLDYWTNRPTNICITCEGKGVRDPVVNHSNNKEASV